jgi:hypothetical protein
LELLRDALADVRPVLELSLTRADFGGAALRLIEPGLLCVVIPCGVQAFDELTRESGTLLARKA